MNNQIGVVVGTIQGSIPCTPFHPKWVRYNQIEKGEQNYGKKENGNKNSRTDNSTGYDA